MTSDSATGIGPLPAGATAPSEQAFYFTNQGQHLFATLHRPAAGAAQGGGWLLCAPFGEERGFAQRTCVEWARALSAAGYWVLRFDYRGYGDSEGLFEEFTAEDHISDILAARVELERRSGVRCQGLWGLRLGASLATLAAVRARLDVALALWDPIVKGDRYMEDLLRWVMVKEMANTGRAPRTRDDLKAHMASGGEVIIEGHPLTDAAYRAIARIDLTALETPFTGRAFIAQVSAKPQNKARREMEALCQALGGAHLELVQVPPPWQQNDEYAVRPDVLFAPTLRWLSAAAPPDLSPAAANPAPVIAAADSEFRSPGGGSERAVSMSAASGVLRAVLHLPPAVDAGRPAVLMVTPGFNCRTARYRLYVRLARELVQRGYVSLRVDPHGIGDSDGELSHALVSELYNAIENGVFVEDTRAAMTYLHRECGIGSVFLIGLCGGATTSVRVGAMDDRVAGIVASELPFLFTPRHGSAEEQAAAPIARAAADHFLYSYVRKLLDPEAWKRFFTMRSDYRNLVTSLKVAVAKRVLPRRIAGDDDWYRERLGPRANLGLVATFRGCLKRRIPILCLFGATRNSWYFSEIWPAFQRAAPGAKARVQTKNIQDADPGFSLPAHGREFLDTALAWTEAHGGARARPSARGAVGA